MRVLLLCKRHYTNADLLRDRFGRLYHLPVQLAAGAARCEVLAADYRGGAEETLAVGGATFTALPLSPARPVRFWAQALRRGRSLRPRFVAASGDVPLGLFGLLLARVLGAAFVFDVYDDYTVFATGRVPGMRHAFRSLLRRADLVVVAGDALRARVVPHAARVVVIPNGFDPEVFRPRAKEEARREAGLPLDQVIVGYFGAIEPDRGVEVLIAAARMLRRQRPGLRLLLAGRKRMRLDLGGAGLDYRGPLPQSEVARLMSACDVLAVPYLPSPQVQASSPCKLAEYAAVRRPVAATRVSNLAESLAASGHGLCAPGDAADLARAIAAQLASPMLEPYPEGLTWARLAGALERALLDTPGPVGAGRLSRVG